MHAHTHAAAGERLATESIVNLDGVVVIHGDGVSAVGNRARARHRLGRLLHDGVAEFVLEPGDKRETRYPRPRPEPLQNFESRFGGIDVGRRLREHLGQVAAARERVLEIARQLFDDRGRFTGRRHLGAIEDIAKMLLDFTIVVAARPNPIVLNPQPFDLIGRARHKIHVAADEVGAIAQQRLKHHGGGGIRSPAEEQLGKFCGGKTATLLLGDLPQQLQIEFSGQFGALAFQVGEGLGDVFAIGASIRMAHQDQIARNQPLVPGGIDHGEMAFLFPGDQSSPEPALVKVLDNGAGVFDRR